MIKFREKFDSPFEQYADRIGQEFTVIGILDDEECDVEEVGTMYQIRFDDGFETAAWPEEVEERWDWERSD